MTGNLGGAPADLGLDPTRAGALDEAARGTRSAIMTVGATPSPPQASIHINGTGTAPSPRWASPEFDMDRAWA